ALGLILGLDWPYADLNPDLEMELFKAQPFIAKLINGHEILSTGAKTLPEGGYYSLPKNYVNGGLIIGDAAGFSNVSKLKALHLAIKSGMAAADALNDAIVSADFSETTLQAYAANLETRGVTGELKKSRNARQGFATPLGLYFGAPFTLIQHLLPLKWKLKADHKHLRTGKLNRTQQPELDRAAFVGFSGAMHEEDEFPHVQILDQNICTKCARLYNSPCLSFCPGEVYAAAESTDGVQIRVSPSNCLHDCSCVVKCPFQNILWTAPEGGEGPKYANM
ncbi:4Fe-4S dicluster domain-containing protein, partial [bacterium]|nr:4Fe-4S dicluster domain-containing protein [bacterium]